MISRDEILALYAAGPDTVVAVIEQLLANQARLEQQVAVLTARVAELEARQNKDSHNSHQPPSSDGPAKRGRSHSLRKPSGKKSGGQTGHPGGTRCLVDDPDQTVVHLPATCPQCGTGLDNAPELQRVRRQVIEIPEPQPVITEHQAVHKTCPTCHTVAAGAFPAAVTQPVQYGPRTKAVAVYLQTYHLLPYERVVALLSDLFGVAPSEGTLANAQTQAYAQLEPVEQATRAALRQADILHTDETGIRVAGRTAWVHVVSNARLTYYAYHAKRGRDAIRAMGILIDFAGRRVHDAWPAYLGLPGTYALCNAHLLRELIGLHEDTGQVWIEPLINLLRTMHTAVTEAQGAGQTALPAAQCAGYEATYTQCLTDGLRANPPPPPTGKQGRPKRTKAGNLLNRLETHRGAIFAFLYDFRVPFDNNQAERDLRMLKVQQKVSGCFRSAAGADHFCRIRGYLSCLRKQGQSILAGLTSLFTGQPVMPRLAA